MTENIIARCRGHTITRDPNWSTQGQGGKVKPLYAVAGPHVEKAAGTRPFLTTIDEAREWIRAQLDAREASIALDVAREAVPVTKLPPGSASGLAPETVGDQFVRQFGDRDTYEANQKRRGRKP